LSTKSAVHRNYARSEKERNLITQLRIWMRQSVCHPRASRAIQVHPRRKIAHLFNRMERNYEIKGLGYLPQRPRDFFGRGRAMRRKDT
jgi:hypothetical protein